MSVRGWLGQVRRASDRSAPGVALLGVLAVSAYNLRCWRADRRLADQLRAERARPLPLLDADRRVSILVAAWNEEDLIGRHIESVQALRYPNREYVLCAGGTDATYELANRHARPGTIVLRQQAGEGKQAALRRCLERATGEIIYLTDADCLLDDASFERTLAPVVRGEAQAATGGSRPFPEQLDRSALAAYVWSADAYVAARTPTETHGLLGRNAAVSREALARAGDLRAEVWAGTDYHLARSLASRGISVQNVPASEVVSDFHERLLPFARQRRRWLSNMVVHGPATGAHHEAARSVVTSLVGVAMLVAPLVSWPLGRAVLSAWAVLALHGALSKARYLAFARIASGTGPGPLLVMILRSVPLTCVELCIGAWAMLSYVQPGRRPSW